MTVRFENPPLVELVAELRWTDPSIPDLPAGYPADFPLPYASEPFERDLPAFSQEMADFGYAASERLIPAGFPIPSETPVVRYRYSGYTKEAGENDHLRSTLFQLGHQLFTANALKPYKSWNEFSPVVESGVKAVLKAHNNKIPSYRLMLRYIDLFDSQYMNGRNHFEFISEIYGFEIKMPNSILNHAKEGGLDVPGLQIKIPLDFGTLRLNMAEGGIQNRRGYLFESIITIDSDIEPSAEKIMENFLKARNVIHEIFVELTGPLKEVMMPVEA